ncbi:MAG: arginine repressor [Clostridiales bacterium]|jgi:transcriptional regulator of arginine metabolism|nr:arginine repressor [Clostridiales bacterium]
MARNTRQQKILELISAKSIETQDELAEELARAQFNVTQATISRDIKELGLIKVTTPEGRQKYSREAADAQFAGKIVSLFKHAVISIDRALNIVVIKTLSGGANSAGLMIDKLNIGGVLGCVAGDDTVMIVTKTEETAEGVVNALNAILN